MLFLYIYPQEGNQVNCHVTAPGAIVALGLMYLKTNDRYIIHFIHHVVVT